MIYEQPTAATLSSAQLCWPGHLVQGKQLFNSRRFCCFRCHQQNIHGQRVCVWDRDKREREVRRAVSGSVLAAATICSSFKCGNDVDNGDSQTTFLWYVTRIFNICTRISILVALTFPLSASLSWRTANANLLFLLRCFQQVQIAFSVSLVQSSLKLCAIRSSNFISKAKLCPQFELFAKGQ